MSTANQQHPLHTLLKPQSVAVIGASPDKTKIRGELFHFMHAGGFKGKLYPVNPSYQDIHGIKCYPDVGSAAKDAGGSLDLAEQLIGEHAGEIERLVREPLDGRTGREGRVDA